MEQMQPFVDSTAVRDDRSALCERLERDGYLFVRGLLPREAVMSVRRRLLEKAAAAVPWRQEKREPVVVMTAFGASSVDWEVSVWCDEPLREARYRSDLHEAGWWALQDAGIVIAFPQLDVHLDGKLESPGEPSGREPGPSA